MDREAFPVTWTELHYILVQRQSVEELRRKMRKACRKGEFTQEDIDYAQTAGRELKKIFVEESARLP